MANTRDLRVNIDGDPSGVDRAFKSAAESAKIFVRELEKLERQEKLQAEALKRAEAATKSFGRSQSDAGEKAIRLGHAAQEAGERANRSMRLAADASDKLARGEIGAEHAAQMEAKALRDVERAALATAVAQRAAAKAAQDEARQEDQAARDALLAAAAQRLEHLRTAGAVKEHNDLLGRLRKDYQGFGVDIQEMEQLGVRGFGALTKAGTAAFNSIMEGAASLGESGPLLLIGIPLLIGALPALAVAAAGAITLGLGGALAALGFVIASKSQLVRDVFAKLGADASAQAHQWAAPWIPAFEFVAGHARTVLAQIGPTFTETFTNMAPAVRTFLVQLEDSLLQLRPAISSVGDNFDRLLAKLGPALPGIMASLASGIMAIAQAAGDHATEITQFAQAIGQAVMWTGKLIQGLAYLEPVLDPLTTIFASIGIGGQKAKGGVSSLTTGFTELSQSAGSAKQQVDDLDKALTAYLTPSLAVFEDTSRLAGELVNLKTALKASHGSLDTNSQAARAAHDAFASYIQILVKTASDQTKMDGNTKRATETIRALIPQLWTMAGSSSDAQQEVMRLAAAFGISIPGQAGKGQKAVNNLKTTIGGLKSKTVTMNVDTSSAMQHLQQLRNMASTPLPTAGLAHGGLVGYAAGGLAGFPGGGRVSGPGTTTSDSIYTRLSNKEFVVNAKDTAANLGLLEYINSGGKLATAVHSPMATLPARPALPAGLASAMRSGASGGAPRLEVVFRLEEPRGGGLMAAIVKNLKYEVRTLGGGDVNYLAG